jgi:predicted TIM-barrel fold metal-dependent hydrolase
MPTPGGQLIVDCDVHPWPQLSQIAAYLPDRWRRYCDTYGTRGPTPGQILMRPFSSRGDSWPPGGGVPGGDPGFASLQLLDEYEITYGVLNSTNAVFPIHSGGNQPPDFSAALMRATNDWLAAEWLESESRWLASICLPFENAKLAVDELVRCREMSDRWVQVMVPVRTHWPLGHYNYTDLFEAAVEHGIPIAIHVGGDGLHQVTGVGWPSYFFENHVGYPQAAVSHVASMVFSGLFDRYPSLRVVMLETTWSWAAPLAWRLDATWRVLRDEVPDLQRKPSEYLEHFWFASQPAEEPERAEWFKAAFEQFTGAGGRLLFASDYPHWDFDSPVDALPRSLPACALEDMLWRNADRLYGLGLASHVPVGAS